MKSYKIVSSIHNSLKIVIINMKMIKKHFNQVEFNIKLSKQRSKVNKKI